MAIIIVQKAKKALFYGIFDIINLMKNNILYIIGVAFALVLMVFFSGFFRNVDFFPAEPKIMNVKTILIETFNDKKADKYWKNQFKKLYENSDFKPTNEMFDNASLCFKEEIFENIINNESENYQKILETEIKIETKDQLPLESIEILTEFQRDFQSAVNSCKEVHIKDKNKDVFLECEVEEKNYISGTRESGKMHLSFNTTDVPFTIVLSSDIAGHDVFTKCEYDDFLGRVTITCESDSDSDRNLILFQDSGMIEYTRISIFEDTVDGYCSKSEKKDIF